MRVIFLDTFVISFQLLVSIDNLLDSNDITHNYKNLSDFLKVSEPVIFNCFFFLSVK